MEGSLNKKIKEQVNHLFNDSAMKRGYMGIWVTKPGGWMNYKEEFINFGICTEAEFEKEVEKWEKENKKK